MARTETVLQAFVASPKDVNDERALLEEIIRELNLTWGLISLTSQNSAFMPADEPLCHD